MLSNDPNFATPILPHEDCDCGDLCAWEPKFEWIESPIKRKFMLNLFNRIHGKAYPELEEVARKHNLKTFKGLISAWNEVKHIVVTDEYNYAERNSPRLASVKGDPKFPLNRANWLRAYRTFRIYSAVRVSDPTYDTYDYSLVYDPTFPNDWKGFGTGTMWRMDNLLYRAFGATHTALYTYRYCGEGEPVYEKRYDQRTVWSLSLLLYLARNAWGGVHGFQNHPDQWEEEEE